MFGMIEASITRRPSTPRTLSLASTTARASWPVRHVIALDRGFGGEVGRIPVGNRLDAVARRRAILGDEIAQARLHGAETLRGRLIAEIALYIGTDRHDRVVVEIFTHLRRIDDHRDAVLAKLLGWPDARVHEDLRAMDAAGRQHNLAGCDPKALVHELDANGPLVLNEDANDGLAGEKGHAAR